MRKILLLFGALLFILPSKAVVIDGLNYSFNHTNMTASISESRGSAGEVVIPSTVEFNGNVYSVTEIGYWAFRDCTDLTSVVIPGSVTSIGSYAFYGCYSLTKVKIPVSVSSIGSYAFYGCSGLTSVVIPNSVTSIGGYAFTGCRGLIKSAYPIYLSNPFDYGISIAYERNAIIEDGVIFSEDKHKIFFVSLDYSGNYEIPNSVTSIENNAFYGCSGLTSVVIGNSVTEIGDFAFRGCSSLSNLIFNAENCTVCGSSDNPAFPNNITSLTIGKDVKNIPDKSFTHCTYLLNLIFNAENCIACGSSDNPAFPSNITSLTIGKDVKRIPDYAFYACSGLKSVEIPNSVTSIGELAFYACRGLTSIVIPNSVTSVGDKAFGWCSGLTSVEISDIAAWCGISFENYMTNPLYYAHNLYLNGELVTKLEIPNSVTSVGNYAFCYCNNLTSVDIPNSVISIEENAFSNCSNLTSVKIGNSVTSIGDSAFSNCSGLKSVEIPNSVTLIGSAAFSDCSSLTSVTIPNSVTSIGNFAFYGCSGLNTVEISNSISEIQFGAFQGCSSLTSVEIPNSVTSIGNEAFRDCSGLTSVVIPNSVTSIGNEAFRACSGLKSITFNSSSFLHLGQSAFSGCYDIAIITCNTQRAPVAETYDVFENDVYSNANLYVPEEQKNLYSTVIPWSKFLNIYGIENTPDDENDYKIVPVLLPSQTLTLGVKNMGTGMLENSFSWNSSDEFVADVDSQGIVTAKAVGETVIIATNSEGKSAEFEILVIEDDDNLAVQEILLESKTNSNVYTLGGLVVIRDATQEDLRSLAPGLYIIGGKKVMVK